MLLKQSSRVENHYLNPVFVFKIVFLFRKIPKLQESFCKLLRFSQAIIQKRVYFVQQVAEG